MSFGTQVRDHMSSYAQDNNIGDGWSEKYKRVYPHVLRVKHRMDIADQAKVIYEENVLPSAKGVLLMPDGRWQSDAHHLNSSQVMCYNFFRPMMNDDGSINNVGQLFVEKVLNINISNSARGYFEYEDPSDEWAVDRTGKGTNFDFYIEDNGTQIFVEVKYSEQAFGTAKHKNEAKYEFYERTIKKVLGFDVTRDQLKEGYQLFRNTIRIGDNSYSIILYPKANADADGEYNSFYEKYNLANVKYSSHAIRVYLEECIEFLKTDFIHKYLPYLE